MSEDQMAPDASPDAVKPKSGVRRVNNMPMYLIGGVLGIFLLVMALVAADRAAQQNQPGAAKAEKAGSTSMFADEIAGKQQDGIIKAKPLEIPPEQTAQQPTTELTPAPAQGTTITVARPENLDQPPTPP
ncbi:conjugal transfer protein TrbI, partial [Morganella morganii]